MLNFLPAEERKRIKGVYRMQLAVVALVFLFITILIATAFLIPADVLMKSRVAVVEQRIQDVSIKVSEHDGVTPEAQLADIKVKMNTLKNISTMTYPSTDMLDILSAKPQGVRMERISYDGKEGKRVFRITGVSNTREALREFESGIRGVSWVGTVVLPIEYLAKERNLDFSITVEGRSEPTE